jgi:hypothetical protein
MPGTTTHFGLPYPVGTDPLKEGAAKAEALANKLDEVLYEKLGLTPVTVNEASGNGEAGKFYVFKAKSQSLTLPAPSEAAQIGCFNLMTEAANTLTVKTLTGSIIWGDFVNGAASVVLAQHQHLMLLSDGTNWYIGAGEPRLENTYSASKLYSKAEMEAGVEPSATRPSFVLHSETTNMRVAGGAIMIGSGVKGAFRVGAGQIITAEGSCELQWVIL